MTLRLALPSIPLALLPVTGAAALQATCHFTTECHDAEPCAATDFDLSIADGADEMTVTLATVSGTGTGALTLAPNGATQILGRSGGTLQLLTIGTDGAARLSLHLADGPVALSYLGTCEDGT